MLIFEFTCPRSNWIILQGHLSLSFFFCLLLSLGGGVCLCVQVSVYVGIDVCVDKCMWRPEDNHRYYSSGAIHQGQPLVHTCTETSPCIHVPHMHLFVQPYC